VNESVIERKASLVLSWRIGLLLYESDKTFAGLCTFLKKHRDVVDEIAMFESNTHSVYIPPPVLQQRAELIRDRIFALKEAGIRSVGINVLATIGHINEAWDSLPALPFQPMIGHDGSASISCACPNTPEFREYMRNKYSLYAGINPDFIWVDDDIRMHHHGVAFGCFCPTCLKIFSEEKNKSYARQELLDALNAPGQGGLREACVEQNVRTTESLLKDIEEAVHGVDPGIDLGLMTVGAAWTTYSGQALDRWFNALKAVKTRPGGGFYTDERPVEMYHKAIEVGRQLEGLPGSVVERQYELENFPYMTLDKARVTVINECSLALGVGLNGIAFNALGSIGDPHLTERESLLQEISKSRPFWETMLEYADGLPTRGLWPAWNRHMTSRQQVKEGLSWLEQDCSYHITLPNELGRIGLPLSVDRPGCAVILAGRVAETMDDAELKQVLSGPVLMDDATLTVLTDRGMDELAGVRVLRPYDNGVVERFTGDPINGPHSQTMRDVRIEFWNNTRGGACVLEPLASDVRTISRLA
jgi:hypothetical protein